MFADYLKFWKDIFTSIPFNVFDYALIILFLIYIAEDISFGLIASGISFVSTVSSFFIALILYPYLSSVFSMYLNFTKGLSDACSFLLTAVFGFVLVSTLLSIIRRKYIIKFSKTVDILGGIVFGSLSFFFIASFAISLLLSFPTSAVVRDAIKNSYTAPFFTSSASGIDHAVRQVFGGAINDTINFLTVEPDSNKSVKLNFKTTSYTVDQASQEEMLVLVNKNRAKFNKAPLEVSYQLTVLAQKHAKDMLARGYFSHYTPEGLSPFDRMANSNISYQYAGENLAFAPDVEIAMDGLMKSPGHRENILNSNFKQVGIGVLDAGIYGKMFVQEFTD